MARARGILFFVEMVWRSLGSKDNDVEKYSSVQLRGQARP
jgi:hypothetical protein